MENFFHSPSIRDNVHCESSFFFAKSEKDCIYTRETHKRRLAVMDCTIGMMMMIHFDEKFPLLTKSMDSTRLVASFQIKALTSTQ